jgi:hypothetical protein
MTEWHLFAGVSPAIEHRTIVNNYFISVNTCTCKLAIAGFPASVCIMIIRIPRSETSQSGFN